MSRFAPVHCVYYNVKTVTQIFDFPSLAYLIGMMNQELNTTFTSWIELVLSEYMHIVDHEVHNRLDPYPALREVVTDTSLDVDAFKALASKCTLTRLVMRYAKEAYNRFFENEVQARYLINWLIKKSAGPSADDADHIDEFVRRMVGQSGLQPPQAALLASLILTTAHPDRFVDYPARKHWVNFAQALNYGILDDSDNSHGQSILWASTFAQEIAATEAFPNLRAMWPDAYSMWIVSGLCWTHKRILNEGDD